MTLTIVNVKIDGVRELNH